MGLTGAHILVSALAAGQAPAAELYQDFRGDRPLLAGLNLFGTVLGAEAEAEPGGLRIKLPADRPSNHPVGLGTKFSLTGDFELTASYELLAASMPKDGYGVGVNLSIATDGKRLKFAKIGRFMRPKEGSVYMSEFWNNEPKKVYQAKTAPTDARAGKLRLAREREVVRCLVADDPPDEFREIWHGNFGTDELKVVHFAVVDGGKPGNAVDVRLTDYRIRSGANIPVEAAQPSPQPAAPPPAKASSGPLWGALAGVLVLLVAGGGLGAWLLWRRRHSSEPAPAAASAGVDARCPSCQKRLKVNASVAGKKIKCPGCATVFVA
jgi:hypothetical protein